VNSAPLPRRFRRRRQNRPAHAASPVQVTNDSIAIYPKSSNAKATVYSGGSSLGEFTVANFTSIRVDAGAGDDTVTVGSTEHGTGSGINTAFDTVVSKPATLNGEADNDTIYGTDQADMIDGGSGNDWLFGAAGNDTVYGRVGNDKVFGESANDVLWGDGPGDHEPNW
jgi:Ca2+-binding RTX toxin-like protein